MSTSQKFCSIQVFAQLFAEQKKQPLDALSFTKSIRSTIIQAFHTKSPETKLSKVQQAEHILEALFTAFITSFSPTLSFSFSEFMAKAHLKKTTLKHILTELLYSLYYGHIDLSHFSFWQENPIEYLQFFLTQIIAEKATKATLCELLLHLPLPQKLALICYAKKNYREGSFFIFQALGASQKQLSQLIQGITENHYDTNFLCTLIKQSTFNDMQSLPLLIDKLEEKKEQDTVKLYTLFNTLMPVLFHFPVTLFNTIEQLKKEGKWLPEMTTITAPQVELQKKHLESCLKTYYENNYSLADFRLFVSIFHLYGYPLLFPENSLESDSLVEKIELILQTFSNPMRFAYIATKTAHKLYSFVFTILAHLYATCKKPSQYKEGLDLLGFGMSTYAKDLSTLQALPTVMQGLTSLIDFLNKTVDKNISLKSYPIFVFDQSTGSLFEKNGRFIKKLNCTFKSAIIHISQQEALLLAQKIGIDSFLRTTPRGAFGFGGARNCLFFLTAPLTHAYKNDLNMEAATLRSLFDMFVLGADLKVSYGDTLFTFDDDMQIASSNIVSGALFAYENRDAHLECAGFQMGRATKFSLVSSSFQEFLHFPEKSFASTRWLNWITSAGFAEYFSKPKVCLNIPHGGEERHLLLEKKCYFLLQLSYHLSGSRFPKKELPTHLFVGLDEYLKSYLPYSLLIQLQLYFVDPINTHGRCILTWNEHTTFKDFLTLNDAFTFMASEKQKEEMQHRFWKNVADFFHTSENKKGDFFSTICDFIMTDIDLELQLFQKQEKLTHSEKKALQKIALLYKAYQSDAKLFWEFGLLLTKELEKRPTQIPEIEQIKNELEKKQQIHFADYPLTEGFYLLTLACGKAEFCTLIKKALAC